MGKTVSSNSWDTQAFLDGGTNPPGLELQNSFGAFVED